MLGDDWCVCCCANLADILLQCPSNHRIYCAGCFERLVEDARRARRELKCGKCMRGLKGGRYSMPISCVEVQLEATRIADVYADGKAYPWEVLLDFGSPQGPADLDTMRSVREAMRKCQASGSRTKLREQLPEMDVEYVFLELIKTVNLHEVLLHLEPLMCRAMPLAEVTTLGVAGAIAGAFLGPAVAVVACPILAAAGGMLGDAMVRGKGRAYAIVGWQCPEHTVVNECAERLGINLDVDGFMEAREKFQQRVVWEELEDAAETKDASQHAAYIADWQPVRNFYAATLCGPYLRQSKGCGDGPGSQKEVGIYINVMKVRGSPNEDWKLARSWFGSAMNAPVSDGDTQKVEVYTLYL
ncbi:unnamed protein product [Cladocopium goreaui]|uniref:Uncharacterized protein n=1 Tax=Cladocopium goreaui TaxID=2562237 RepID=A0A9P1FKT2_9DINO|nr:unnamed protein product [Cladocopium goreaui]